ncbi:MAG: DUF5615 family PIN-like protein [Methyloceanibacter sp.]
MRLFLDENVRLRIVLGLRDAGYDVDSIIEHPSRVGSVDEDVLLFARSDDRILVTKDSDFGTLLFQRKLDPPRGVVFIRWDSTEETVDRYLEFFENETDETLAGRFTTVTVDKVRRRPLRSANPLLMLSNPHKEERAALLDQEDLELTHQARRTAEREGRSLPLPIEALRQLMVAVADLLRRPDLAQLAARPILGRPELRAVLELLESRKLSDSRLAVARLGLRAAVGALEGWGRPEDLAPALAALLRGPKMPEDQRKLVEWLDRFGDDPSLRAWSMAQRLAKDDAWLGPVFEIGAWTLAELGVRNPEEISIAVEGIHAADLDQARAEPAKIKKPEWARARSRRPELDKALLKTLRAAEKRLATRGDESSRRALATKVAWAEEYLAKSKKIGAYEPQYKPRLPSGKRLAVPRGDDCQVLAAMAQQTACALAAEVQPASCEVCELPQGKLYDSEGRAYDFEVAVLPLEELLTSHDDAGRVDSRFPQEFQARDRSAAESRLDIERMARTLDPERLVQVGPSPAEGAPVVWEDESSGLPLVLAGNGRVMALRAAPEERQEAYFGLVESLTGRQGVLVRRVSLDRAEALALAAASQRSASAPESPLEQARALLRGVAGVSSYADLPLLELGQLNAPLTENNVTRFEGANPALLQKAFPNGAPASPAARADRYRAIFLGLLPGPVAETVQALGFEAEEALAGLSPFLAELFQKLSKWPPSVAWLDPLPRLARAAPLMRRFKGRSRASILASITADVENLHMFGSPLEGLEALDVGWLLGLLSALNVQAPEKRGVELGRALRAHAIQEARDAESSFFGYEPEPLKQVEAIFGPQVRALLVKFEENLASMGLGMGRKNPGRGPAGLPLDELYEDELDDASFEAAMRAAADRYSAEPTEAIPIKPIPGASKFLTPIGEVARIEYYAADSPGEARLLWYHDAGDHGGRKRTKPPLLVWDPINEQIYFAQPEGSDLRFTERGIVG